MQQTLDSLFTKVQLSLKMNKSVVKVLRATAEYMDMPFSALIESMAVTALQGDCVFGPDVLKRIEQFQEIYGMNAMLDALAGEGPDEEGLEGGEVRQPRRAGKDAPHSGRAK